MDFAALCALGSSLSFATASMAYTRFAREISPQWMNHFKSFVAFFAFGLAVLLIPGARGSWPEIQGVSALLLSGLIGLCAADFFLLGAYHRMGPARTLVIYSFEPLILGFFASLFLNQPLRGDQLLPIGCLIGCSLSISYEGYRTRGHWEIRGVMIAVAGVCLDSAGVLLTRSAFDHAPGMTAFQANFIRTVGALAGFMAYSRIRPARLFPQFLGLAPRMRGLALAAGFFGTFVSLALWLTAIRSGHLASVAAIGAGGPVFTTLFEAVSAKKFPGPYLLLALLLFVVGFLSLTLWSPHALS